MAGSNRRVTQYHIYGFLKLLNQHVKACFFNARRGDIRLESLVMEVTELWR